MAYETLKLHALRAAYDEAVHEARTYYRLVLVLVVVNLLTVLMAVYSHL